jgi:hypothetical protein
LISLDPKASADRHACAFWCFSSNSLSSPLVLLFLQEIFDAQALLNNKKEAVVALPEGSEMLPKDEQGSGASPVIQTSTGLGANVDTKHGITAKQIKTIILHADFRHDEARK